MIVADASAIVAIVDEEPEADSYFAVLSANETALSPINYVEAGVVLIGRQRVADRVDLDRFLDRLGISLATGSDLAAEALNAYLRFGRGFHPAKLNLGDCFAYALAKALDAPLLYKGDDFVLTDIRSALQPT